MFVERSDDYFSGLGLGVFRQEDGYIVQLDLVQVVIGFFLKISIFQFFVGKIKNIRKVLSYEREFLQLLRLLYYEVFVGDVFVVFLDIQKCVWGIGFRCWFVIWCWVG